MTAENTNENPNDSTNDRVARPLYARDPKPLHAITITSRDGTRDARVTLDGIELHGITRVAFRFESVDDLPRVQIELLAASVDVDSARSDVTLLDVRQVMGDDSTPSDVSRDARIVAHSAHNGERVNLLGLIAQQRDNAYRVAHEYMELDASVRRKIVVALGLATFDEMTEAALDESRAGVRFDANVMGAAMLANKFDAFASEVHTALLQLRRERETATQRRERETAAAFIDRTQDALDARVLDTDEVFALFDETHAMYAPYVAALNARGVEFLPALGGRPVIRYQQRVLASVLPPVSAALAMLGTLSDPTLRMWVVSGVGYAIDRDQWVTYVHSPGYVLGLARWAAALEDVLTAVRYDVDESKPLPDALNFIAVDVEHLGIVTSKLRVELTSKMRADLDAQTDAERAP